MLEGVEDLEHLRTRLLVDPPATAILSDFDGTLAAIVPDPAAARALRGVAEVLKTLSFRFGLVAVISGRPASFLAAQLAGAGDKLRIFGAYGMEWVEDGVVRRVPQSAEWTARARQVLEDAERHAPPGLVVEDKGSSVTLHWRESPDTEPWAQDFARTWTQREGFLPRPGRMALELSPPLGIDKGKVVERLAADFKTACFVGDDAGDLSAFAALRRLQTKGLSAICIAVADAESPEELVASADAVLGGPEMALELFREIADAGGEPESRR